MIRNNTGFEMECMNSEKKNCFYSHGGLQIAALTSSGFMATFWEVLLKIPNPREGASMGRLP